MMQVHAILLDSLRELRSRSLFWIALFISVTVSVSLFGLLKFEENGWRVLWFSVNESDLLREGSAGAKDLITWLFGGVLMWWWLTWGAIVLALITTASTIPDFVSSGGIDVVLSKPIGRLRLLAVKLLSALLFMLLQVTICVAIGYLLAGLRFDIWFHGAWLAVPLVTLQFFYLFAVMALVGLVTRSSLASLLAVLLFWGTVSIVQFAANQMQSMQAESTHNIELAERRIEQIQGKAAQEGRELSSYEQARIEGIENRTQPMRAMLETLGPWSRPIQRVELLVPKTGDIQKIVAEQVEAPTFAELIIRLQGFDPDAMAKMAGMGEGQDFRDAQEAGVVGERAARKVNVPVSIGTSLGFTSLVLLISFWIFCRRDF